MILINFDYFQTALSNLEEMQHNSMSYRNNERGRSMGVGPVRPRPMEKRHDTSPYNYLSPPPSDTWRRTNSDSALHQSANEACHSSSSMHHRRGSDACRFPIFFLLNFFFFDNYYIYTETFFIHIKFYNLN